MKKLFSIIALLFLTKISISQEKIDYADFIQTDTGVKWAAIGNYYINLTPVNPNFNLSNYFFNKLKKASLIAYRDSDKDLSVTRYNVNYNDIISGRVFEKNDPEKTNWIFNYDDKHDATEEIFYKDSNDCDTCLLNKLSFFKVKQLLYYKNHQLKIKNIFINPIVYKKKQEQRKEETLFAETFNVCFNPGESDNRTIPSSAVFINRTCNKITLSATPSGNFTETGVLTINNWSLGNQLFKDIKAKKIKAYDTEMSIYPTSASVIQSKQIEAYHNPPIEVMVYDVEGNVTGTKKVLSEINYDSLYTYKLIQDFYFDFATEKMYSKLIAFVPQINVITSSGISLGLTDYWGVIFDENTRKIVSKKK
ncbi:hypothetical protein LK994_11480 [Ferruginibacter lapsinanis]|uniref:hypothetical protein n=1 Tax=Ferruginibacter lapsinanis TaxID=563172 RepID=UPI001E34B098|nr:hypothetical protein [Ferruginibacter lapsinanis]UEG49252.1 hypothetical protein LK994_11480 [Ferruginibacter lapsinanis]